LASLYCNRATREAFYLLFRELFSAVERVTGKPLQFSYLSNGAGKLRCVIFDAEAAQMQGFGDFVASINNPSISGLSVTDPLDLASRLAKTCSVHFDRFVFHFDNMSVSVSFWIQRNIEDFPKNIPEDVIRRLKNFRYLDTLEDIDNWREFCANSPHVEVHSKSSFVRLKLTKYSIQIGTSRSLHIHGICHL
jgi:hypothetical protein